MHEVLGYGLAMLLGSGPVQGGEGGCSFDVQGVASRAGGPLVQVLSKERVAEAIHDGSAAVRLLLDDACRLGFAQRSRNGCLLRAKPLEDIERELAAHDCPD